MADTLLSQFLAEEGIPYVRQLLRDALVEKGSSHRRFEFNRFNVTIDRSESVVLLEDILDTQPSGAIRIPLPEFAAALGRTDGDDC
jgi:hypothetical protein